MLGYLILVAVQVAAAWYLAPEVMGLLPSPITSGDLRNFVHAAIFAVIVWIVGVIGSLVLKDVKMPGSATLVSALAGALIGALIIFFPQVKALIPFRFPDLLLPLLGAVIGYLVRR